MSDILGMSDLRTIQEEEEEDEVYRRNTQFAHRQANGAAQGQGQGHGAVGGTFDGQIDPELLENEDGRRGFPRVSISMTPQRQANPADAMILGDESRNGHASYDQANLSRLVRPANGGGVHANSGYSNGNLNAGSSSGGMWQHTTTLAGMERDGSESVYQEHEEDEEYEQEPARRKSGPRRSMGEEGSGEDISGAEGTAGRKRVKVDSKTCDNCRKRKIKCKEEEGLPADSLDQSCEGCRKLGIECTFEYVKKKPGRKNGFVLKMRAAQEAALQGLPPPVYPANPPPKRRRISDNSHLYPSNPVPLIPPLPANPADPNQVNPPAQPPRPRSSFNFSPKRSNGSFASNARSEPLSNDGLDWLENLLEGTAFGSVPGNNSDLFSDQAHLLAFESPENASTSGPPSSGTTITPFTNALAFNSGVNGGGANYQAGLLAMTKREPQLEDVTSWANISHFISLWLQYLYPLLPLVHRPTFAEHLATRRDLRDTDFRALLLSIVAYVISQLPTTRLVNDQFDIEGLKRLQRKCHRTCKALQRTYYGPTNLTQITTIVFDMFYLLSIGLGHTAGARLGQAVQLAFSMGMHSDERTNALGLDAIEVQLRRRVFWQLYASDKTRAVPGPPMLINDFQSVSSLPSPIDDEFITSQGMFPQPSSKTSILSGFVIVSQVFRILSETFFHHRCVTTGFKGVGIGWTIEAEERLHKVLKDMPLAIQDPEGHGGIGKGVFAMQRANVLITAAITKFALYDLRAALNIKTDQLAKEREMIAREIHQLLMNIPVEDLASNGESMRGKVFHIACALFAQGSTVDEQGQDLIKDWCNMFSAISFVQMPPPPIGQEEDSRGATPTSL